MQQEGKRVHHFLLFLSKQAKKNTGCPQQRLCYLSHKWCGVQNEVLLEFVLRITSPSRKAVREGHIARLKKGFSGKCQL